MRPPPRDDLVGFDGNGRYSFRSSKQQSLANLLFSFFFSFFILLLFVVFDRLSAPRSLGVHLRAHSISPLLPVASSPSVFYMVSLTCPAFMFPNRFLYFFLFVNFVVLSSLEPFPETQFHPNTKYQLGPNAFDRFFTYPPRAFDLRFCARPMSPQRI